MELTQILQKEQEQKEKLDGFIKSLNEQTAQVKQEFALGVEKALDVSAKDKQAILDVQQKDLTAFRSHSQAELKKKTEALENIAANNQAKAIDFVAEKILTQYA